MRNEARLVTFLARAVQEIADDGTQWIEVMATATEARNGKWFFTITTDDLETYAQTIRAQPGTIPVDYDHAETGVGTKAAGWFTGEAEVRGSGGAARLWAQVKWTSSAAEAIRDGEWKRISPEFTFAEKDPKTGLMTKAKELIAATLTNRPFFDELSPVTAAVIWEPGEGLQDLLSRVFDALNPGGYDNAAYWVMDVTQSKALVGEYDGQRTWVVPFTISESGEIDPAPRADWTPAEQEWVEAASASLKTTRAMRPFTEGALMHDSLKAVAAELGLADDSTDEQVIEAVKAVKVKAESEPASPDDGNDDGESVRLDRDTVAKLTASAAKGEEAAKKLHDLERETFLAKAIEEGKILPVQKDAYATMFDVDAENVKALLEVTPARSFNEIGHGDAGEEDADLEKVRARLSYRSSAGEFEADDESLKLHAAAEKILAEAGKKSGRYTEAEYREALFEARGIEA